MTRRYVHSEPYRLKHRQREEQIRVMFVGGATLDKIGRSLGVSRQRIHQILHSRPTFKEWHEGRRQANLMLVAGYNPTPVCQRCHSPSARSGTKYARFCQSCRGKIRVILRIQSLLRRKDETVRARKWDTYHYLSNAACLIRKHNLKPEDFL